MISTLSPSRHIRRRRRANSPDAANPNMLKLAGSGVDTVGSIDAPGTLTVRSAGEPPGDQKKVSSEVQAVVRAEVTGAERDPTNSWPLVCGLLSGVSSSRPPKLFFRIQVTLPPLPESPIVKS